MCSICAKELFESNFNEVVTYKISNFNEIATILKCSKKKKILTLILKSLNKDEFHL